MRANTFIKISLFVFGCLPMIGLYAVLSIGVLFFAVPAIFVGNPLNILSVIWWLLGSFGLYALIQSCASYGRTLPLPRWQRVGLIMGSVLTLPLIGFLEGLGILGLFGVGAAAVILITQQKSAESNDV